MGSTMLNNNVLNMGVSTGQNANAHQERESVITPINIAKNSGASVSANGGNAAFNHLSIPQSFKSRL